MLCALSTHVGYGGTECKQCLKGTFGEGGSTEPCVACGLGRSSPPGSPSSEYCQCPAGSGLASPGDTVCTVCPSGTYQPGPLALAGARGSISAALVRVVVAAQCRACPEGRVSPPGSNSSDDCGELIDVPLRVGMRGLFCRALGFIGAERMACLCHSVGAQFRGTPPLALDPECCQIWLLALPEQLIKACRMALIV